MENFSALYTDILLADRATIGNACFYGNYMFSQNGEGELSTFDITTENPYESNGFKPAWCVNLVTGEMWTGTGSSYFAGDGSGYLANNKITFNADGTATIGGIEIDDAGLGTALDNSLAGASSYLGKYGTISLGKVENELVVNTNHTRMSSMRYDGRLLDINSQSTSSDTIAGTLFNVDADDTNFHISNSELKFMVGNIGFEITSYGIRVSSDGGASWKYLFDKSGEFTPDEVS